MGKPGIVIKFTARPEEAEAFAAILEEAAGLVEADPGTTPWMAVRAVDDPNTFFVVDLHADRAALDGHVNGPAGALVLGEGGKLLSAEPEITIVGLLAGKDLEVGAIA
jgi:quinol monooxygenase YgiN